MQLLLTSPDAIATKSIFNPDVVQSLKNIQAAGHAVGVASNGAEPPWFGHAFSGSKVAFLVVPGRQSGAIVTHNTANFTLNPWDALVLCAKRDDVQMGKNGGAVIIGAAWAPENYVRTLGINVQSPTELETVVALSDGWPGGYWYSGDEPYYSVRALTDLSGYGAQLTQRLFASKVTQTVKHGGPHLMPLLTVAARSLLASGLGSWENMMWGVYPGSSVGSLTADTEVLSDFTHRLRTTVSQVRLAKLDVPLFYRHTASPKRSKGGGGDRENPSNQIETIHLNPAYRRNIAGRNVVVVDDCTTYGVSFGVAAAFLRAAGAASVTGVALGKFGWCLNYYEIDINTDPFAPVQAGGYRVNLKRRFNGATNSTAQTVLRTLIK